MLSGRYVISKSVMGGDAVIYYANIKSILFDGDLDLRNDYEHFYNQVSSFTGNRKLARIPNENPATGKLPILYPIGNVILLAPFFFVGHLIAIVLQHFGFAVTADGFGAIYQNAVAFGSLSYAFIGLVCINRIGNRFFDSETSLVGTLLIWAGTPLIYYMTMEPLMSHALSMFCVSSFVYLWLLVREQNNKYGFLALGMAGGLLSITRYQDGLFLIIPVLDMAINMIRGNNRKSMTGGIFNGCFFISGVLLIASIQFYVNFVLNGDLLATGYMVEGYHPTNLFKYWDSPKILSMLFSTGSGLLLWAPIIGFSLLGLYKFYRENTALSIPLITSLILQFYLVSSWHDPSQADSFGNRYLVNCSALFALGLMQFLHHFRTAQKFNIYNVLFSVFVIINGVLIVLYSLRIIGSPY